jgi:hypothetical protein
LVGGESPNGGLREAASGAEQDEQGLEHCPAGSLSRLWPGL